MKTLTLIVIALVVGQCSTYLIKVPTNPTQPGIGSFRWVRMQKLMLSLFENVCEESTDEIVIRLSNEFNFDSIADNYTKPDVVDNLRNLKTSKGFLPKGEIFSEYSTIHMSELKALYEIFYYAKDFDTFYRSACWARQNVNCGLFVDATYLAILNRKDMSKISVPAPYQLIPNYFISKEVIFKISTLLNGQNLTDVDNVRIENNAYILDANYTMEINDDNEDSKLAYFREDIGLNSYYFLRKLRNAPWFNTPSYINNSYGENMFLMMKQFAARYDLERYSNGLPELESLNLDSVIAAYNPMLIYSNGNEFSHRTASDIFNNNDDVNFLKTIESNLATIVIHLRQAGHNKTQILNHLIEIMVTFDKSYESVAHRLLGCDTEVNERQYSTLEHYLTSMRDPIFWKINKKIVELIDNALQVLPSYSRKELYFPGVEILNVDTKKMITSFESFKFDVTDYLKTSIKKPDLQVKIEQFRLDHKPFTLKFNISSLVTQKGLIKIYIGSKTMPGEFASRKNSFVLMDSFELNLQRGANIVSRSSGEMKSFSNDFIPIRVIRKNIEDAEFGLDALTLTDVVSQVGYPSRLVLPKGLPEGLPIQLFVFVAPISQYSLGGSDMPGNMDFNSAIMSPGYPLDLKIDENQFFNLPNVFMKDIVITHKGEVKSSAYTSNTEPKKWNSNKSYDSSNFDYTYKKESNYNKLQDYSGELNFSNGGEKRNNLLGKSPSFTYKNKNNSPTNNQFKNDYSFKIDDNQKQDHQINNENKFSYLENEQAETKFENTVMKDKNNNILDKQNYPPNAKSVFTYGNKSDSDTRSKRSELKNKENFISMPINFTNTASTVEKVKKYKSNENSTETTYGSLDINKINNQKVQYSSTPSHSKYANKYKNNNLDTSHEKVHGVLRARPDFTYKKDAIDYSAKINQYKNKKEQYSNKEADYTKGTYSHKDEIKKDDVLYTTEKQAVLENTDYTKYISIDDKNNKLIKNVTERKNIYLNERSNEKFDTTTKEIFENPVTIKSNTIVKDLIQYPIIMDYDRITASDSYVKDAEDDKINEPVYTQEIPNKILSVYDFLFKNNSEDKKVYE